MKNFSILAKYLTQLRVAYTQFMQEMTKKYNKFEIASFNEMNNYRVCMGLSL